MIISRGKNTKNNWREKQSKSSNKISLTLIKTIMMLMTTETMGMKINSPVVKHLPMLKNSRNRKISSKWVNRHLLEVALEKLLQMRMQKQLWLLLEKRPHLPSTSMKQLANSLRIRMFTGMNFQVLGLVINQRIKQARPINNLLKLSKILYLIKEGQRQRSQ